MWTWVCLLKFEVFLGQKIWSVIVVFTVSWPILPILFTYSEFFQTSLHGVKSNYLAIQVASESTPNSWFFQTFELTPWWSILHDGVYSKFRQFFETRVNSKTPHGVDSTRVTYVGDLNHTQRPYRSYFETFWKYNIVLVYYFIRFTTFIKDTFWLNACKWYIFSVCKMAMY